MLKKWGIYNGFNPRINPLNKWIEPLCNQCKTQLSPWVDWWSYGCIGYCEKCEGFYFVKSNWVPSPEAHPRAEIDELAGHEIDFLFSDVLNLWSYHEDIPLALEKFKLLDSERLNIRESNLKYHPLISHLIWSLLANSQHFTGTHAGDYLDFLMKYPHYLTMDEKEIWIGHEFDISDRILTEFKEEITQKVFELWQRFKPELTDAEFRSGVGFYIVKDKPLLLSYGPEFYQFSQRINKRLA